MRGLYLVSVWLHILAAMTWVGGMVIFVAAVMSSRIPLTAQELTVAIDKLKEANRLHHAPGAPVPSH